MRTRKDPVHVPADYLPIPALLALAMTGFVAIMTETIPAGLLPMIGAGLGVSEAAAGQLVTLYAAGSLVAAIPLVTATLGWRRRHVLLLSVSGLLTFNTVTAVSHIFAVTLVARFMAGISAGLAWGIVGSYARRMVTDRLQGRALALAMLGTPMALSLGVPAGTFGGHFIGWRVTFLALSLLTLGLAGWIRWKVPDYPGQSRAARMPMSVVLIAPGVAPVMVVTFAWMLAHNLLYTFIAPFLAHAGLADDVGPVLLLFGVCALLGVWLAGQLVDRRLRATVLASLAAFAVAALVLIAGGYSPPALLIAIAIWGVTFGGASTLLNTAAADAAGEGVDLVLALVTTVWNLAIAGGGLVGATVLTGFDPALLPGVALAATLTALVVAWRAESGFPRGPRMTAS